MKGERLQSIAGENRRRFVKLYMASWTPPPQFIVIHRWQIIVNQGIRMNHFECARRSHESVIRRAEGLSRGENESRPETFATRENAPANRAVKAMGFFNLFGKQAIQFGRLFARERIRTNGDLRFDREDSLSSCGVREQGGHVGKT